VPLRTKEVNVSDFTIQRRDISEQAVQAMLVACVEMAGSLSLAFSIAVVDRAGLLAGFRRMEGATQISVRTAQTKAYSAVLANRPTHAWESVFAAEPMLRVGIPPGIPGLIVIGGGYPVVIDGETIGGIGVSGAHYQQDMEVARAGLTAIGAEI
jgi:uncharacterized protein GlcG (DUF336 family)